MLKEVKMLHKWCFDDCNGVALGVNVEKKRSCSMLKPLWSLLDVTLFTFLLELKLYAETAMQRIVLLVSLWGFQSRSGQHYGYCSRRWRVKMNEEREFLLCVCVNVWILWFLWFLYHFQSYSIMLEKSGEYKMDLPLFGLMF